MNLKHILNLNTQIVDTDYQPVTMESHYFF